MEYMRKKNSRRIREKTEKTKREINRKNPEGNRSMGGA